MGLNPNQLKEVEKFIGGPAKVSRIDPILEKDGVAIHHLVTLEDGKKLTVTLKENVLQVQDAKFRIRS